MNSKEIELNYILKSTLKIRPTFFDPLSHEITSLTTRGPSRNLRFAKKAVWEDGINKPLIPLSLQAKTLEIVFGMHPTRDISLNSSNPFGSGTLG